MKIIYSADKPLHWVGSSKKDLLSFPNEVIGDVGYALGVVQQGGVPPSAKHWKGEGAGVLEIVEDHKGDTFRVVYTVRFERAIYVLHCFQKKITLWNQNSKHGRGVNPRTFEVGYI